MIDVVKIISDDESLLSLLVLDLKLIGFDDLIANNDRDVTVSFVLLLHHFSHYRILSELKNFKDESNSNDGSFVLFFDIEKKNYINYEFQNGKIFFLKSSISRLKGCFIDITQFSQLLLYSNEDILLNILAFAYR